MNSNCVLSHPHLKWGFLNNPPALENLFFKIILMVKLLADPKLPLASCFHKFCGIPSLADIFDCAIFLYTLYIVFLHVGDNPTVGSTENPQCGSTMSVNKWQRMTCGKKGRYVNVIRAVPNLESH